MTKSQKKKLSTRCQKELSKKIRINIKERKWKPKQAIAIAYSQIKKKKC